MILGRIIGKSSTKEFMFLVSGDAKKFEYVQVMHPDDYYVLGQIVEIEKEGEDAKAKCNILGRRDNGLLKGLRIPLEPGSEVLFADDEFVEKTLGLEEGAYFGILEGRENIKVCLDLNRLITKHVAFLAKSGSGKSYSVSVLLEEILEKNIPIVVIDPHGEYGGLRYPNNGKYNFERFKVKPKGYRTRVQEFSPDVEKNPESKILRLSSRNLTGSELMHLLPAKLSGAQTGILYSAIKEMGKVVNFDDLLVNLQLEENNAKWGLISVLEYLKNLNLFSEVYTGMNEIVQAGKCSIINLKGIPQEIQEIVVYRLVNDLFNARKLGDIPPFFLVLEEAHNFISERSFGESKSNNILRQVAAEGRKFGVGLCIISQRSARVDKTVLSQTGTQIILKLTNPNDLRAVSSSVEGITYETEKEIRNLHVGNALVIGVVDMPLFVEVRPRRTRHGGEAVDIVKTFEDIKTEDKRDDRQADKEVLSVVCPSFSKEDVKLMSDEDVEVKTVLVPCYALNCLKDNLQYNLLVDLHDGQLITDVDSFKVVKLSSDVGKLNEVEMKIVKSVIGQEEFSSAELFNRSGLQFSEIYNVINDLVKKKWFVSVNDKFKFNSLLDDFLDIDKVKCFFRQEFIGVDYDEKLEKKYDIKQIISFLNLFFVVRESKEVYLVRYSV